MPSGGHARSGPAPDPNALRRDRVSDAATWIHLPATGRSAPPPPWPLAAPTQRERGLWKSEWTRPQALMWEALGQMLEVALFVRAVVVAEGPKATAADRSVVARLMDGLGLTVGGLARNRWIIDSEPERKQVARTDGPDRSGAKARFKTLEGGVA
jgi:hypothetical protein